MMLNICTNVKHTDMYVEQSNLFCITSGLQQCDDTKNSLGTTNTRSGKRKCSTSACKDSSPG